MIHGLEAPSYSTVSCPYKYLRQHPPSIIFLILFLAPTDCMRRDSEHSALLVFRSKMGVA